MERDLSKDLALKDKLFTELQQKIQHKREFLMDRYDAIREASKENALLNGVLKDYVNYYKEVIEAKKREEAALVMLRDYLDTISSAVLESEEQMEHLRAEKAQTINYLSIVRQDMQKLLDKTKQTYKI